MPEEKKEELDVEEKEDETKDDSLEDVLLEGLEKEEQEEVDLGEESEKEEDEPSKKKKTSDKDDAEKTELESLKEQLSELRNDKIDLNKALHQARQKAKATKKEVEAPLTDAQLLKILDEADNDPQTVLNVVRYQAEQAARKISGEAISGAELKRKQRESDKVLYEMYPSLSDESSDIRKAVDETKSYYGLDGNPLGDFFATGVQVLSALPGLLSAAEKRGEEKALKGKADDRRKKSIKDNLSHAKGGKKSFVTGLSESQAETAKQLGLSEPQMKTFKKIVGKATSVSVGE